MLRQLTPLEIDQNLDDCADLSRRIFNRSMLDGANFRKYWDNGAAIYHVIADFSPEAVALAQTQPNYKGAPFLARAHVGLFFYRHDEYLKFQEGKSYADLEPYEYNIGDKLTEPASCFVVTAISQVPFGMAKLMVAAIDDLKTHPLLPVLKNIFWFTRSAKGQALTDIFDGDDTGFTFHNKITGDRYPFFTLESENWLRDIDTHAEHILNIDTDFTREVADRHLQNIAVGL